MFKIGNGGGVTDKIIDHIKNVRGRYLFPDQDLLNIVCAGHILRLPPQYNFPPIHRVLPDDLYFKETRSTFYTKEEMAYARKAPVILHTYRFLGQFPWHKDTLHPDKPLFDQYIERSPWKGYQPQLSPQDTFYRIERLIYRFCPKWLFFWSFNTAQEMQARKKERKLKKEQATQKGQQAKAPHAASCKNAGGCGKTGALNRHA